MKLAKYDWLMFDLIAPAAESNRHVHDSTPKPPPSRLQLHLQRLFVSIRRHKAALLVVRIHCLTAVNSTRASLHHLLGISLFLSTAHACLVLTGVAPLRGFLSATGIAAGCIGIAWLRTRRAIRALKDVNERIAWLEGNVVRELHEYLDMILQRSR